MDCRPIDESENRQFEKYQFHTITAILERSTLDRYCFLTQLTRKPGNPRQEELAFAVKGLLRCNFRQAKDGLRWRRLFGTTKQGWSDEYRNLKLPLSWRSRVLFHTFSNQQQAQNFLSHCPLRLWAGRNACPHQDVLQQWTKGDTWVLLQVEDVKLDESKKFSETLHQFLQDEKSIFSYKNHCLCPSLPGSPGGSAPANLAARQETIKIVWQLEPLNLVHTGVSLDFAKAFLGQRGEPHSRNLRLSHPESPAELTPALLVSSLKGVIRSAMAWLFEKTARQCGWASQQKPFTSDYWQGEKDFTYPCPVRAILGGPLPLRYPAEDHKKTESASAKGLINFSAPPGAFFQARARENWNDETQASFRFARKLLYDCQRDKALLNIETIEIDNPQLITEISPGLHSTAALLALCLAADLISAGFFRLGRFTSRGFGIIRLTPVSVCTGTLVDFLNENAQNLPGAASGIELLTQTFNIDAPLAQLAGWLQGFANTAEEAP